MPRPPRVAPGGLVYHVLNRAVGRMVMFRREGGFAAFERTMQEAHELHPIRILSYCLMSNHWHFVVWPEHDGQVTAFFRWLTHAHAMRWRVSHHTVGYGHLYQGRFKSFPVARDAHLLSVCRYVERNALAAKLVERAEQWRWSSLWVRKHGTKQQKSLLSPWPVERGRDWIELVNQPPTDAEREAIETSERRGRPLGNAGWTAKMARELGLGHTVRREGRPEKAPEDDEEQE